MFGVGVNGRVKEVVELMSDGLCRVYFELLTVVFSGIVGVGSLKEELHSLLQFLGVLDHLIT